MKRFGVNLTRTITVEQTVYVNAKNDTDAIERIQKLLESGCEGIVEVTFKKARLAFKEAEETSVSEEVQTEDAWEDE